MTDSHGTLPDDEPKTPMWLPGLGAALFIAVALWWAVTPSAAPIAPDDTAPSASAAAAPPVPSPSPQGAQAAMAAGSAAPAHSGIMRLNPAVEERLKKVHEGQLPAPPGRHP